MVGGGTPRTVHTLIMNGGDTPKVHTLIVAGGETGHGALPRLVFPLPRLVSPPTSDNLKRTY